VHGHEQEVTLGVRRVLLYPLYHPAAALYTPSMLKVLEEDFARIPELLARTNGEALPAQGEADDVQAAPAEEAAVQLGLF
jgi:DNA polymerase